MSVIRLRPDAVEWRLVDGEVIALDLRTSRYLGLNATAAVLWEAIAVGTTTAALVELLRARYALEPEQAEADVSEFLADLDQRELLEVA